MCSAFSCYIRRWGLHFHSFMQRSKPYTLLSKPIPIEYSRIFASRSTRERGRRNLAKRNEPQEQTVPQRKMLRAQGLSFPDHAELSYLDLLRSDQKSNCGLQSGSSVDGANGRRVVDFVKHRSKFTARASGRNCYFFPSVMAACPAERIDLTVYECRHRRQRERA